VPALIEEGIAMLVSPLLILGVFEPLLILVVCEAGFLFAAVEFFSRGSTERRDWRQIRKTTSTSDSISARLAEYLRNIC
jgi:hypothetical protein